MVNFPEIFVENVISVWGTRGSDWLKQLDGIIISLCSKWQLSNIRVFDNLSFNYAALAYSDKYKTDVVIKISISDADCSDERKALMFYNGNGCVKLLEYDNTKFAMLLEAIKPGTSLKNLFPHDERKACEYAAQVIKKLHFLPKPQNFQNRLDDYPKLETWLHILHSFSDKTVIDDYLKKAQIYSDKLLRSQKDLYLLHGDLHHENILCNNILSNSNSWVAIDPKGVVGELAYEVGAFIRNPLPELLEQRNAGQILSRRFDFFSNALNIERRRLVEWNYVQAVLSACWALQDGGDKWKEYTYCADLIHDLI